MSYIYIYNFVIIKKRDWLTQIHVGLGRALQKRWTTCELWATESPLQNVCVSVRYYCSIIKQKNSKRSAIMGPGGSQWAMSEPTKGHVKHLRRSAHPFVVFFCCLNWMNEQVEWPIWPGELSRRSSWREAIKEVVAWWSLQRRCDAAVADSSGRDWVESRWTCPTCWGLGGSIESTGMFRVCVGSRIHCRVMV